MKFLDPQALKRQLDHQRASNFVIDEIPWAMGVDPSKFCLPLDEKAVCFPGASEEQRTVLSQYFGLLFNAITCEMESVAYDLKEIAWRPIIDSYPANSELYELGEQFFEEEQKHSEMLLKYNQSFCDAAGMDISDLNSLFPTLEGSRFKRMIQKNATNGGHAFWWVVAATEDVATRLFIQINKHKVGIDPLFFHTQKLHFEEETKHASYAFMMLKLIQEKNHSVKGWAFLKSDLLKADLYGAAWLLSALRKTFKVKQLKHKSPFFEVLASCLPLLRKQGMARATFNFWRQAPYISLYLNKQFHKHSLAVAKQHGALQLPYPKPVRLKTFTK